MPSGSDALPCLVSIHQRQRDTIAERREWKFFVALLTNCAVPSYDKPFQRTGCAGR